MRVPEPPSDDEIQARLRRAAARAHSNPNDTDEDRLLHLEEELNRLDDAGPSGGARRATLPENDPEFARRLDNLSARARKIRVARDAEDEKMARVQRQGRDDTKHLATGMVIAYTFLGTPLAGLAVGAIVSRLTGFGPALYLGGFAGILAGCVVSVVLLRSLNRG